MQVFETVDDFKSWRQKQNGSLALIPTMGAIHAGHVSLIEKAQTIADHVVVYIFVNPLQFAPGEDFDTYPRPLKNDLAACEKAKTNVVFCPTEKDIYPEGKDNCTKVVPPAFLGDILEGKFRPGFFTGVTSVLTRFFNIVQPDIAIFGEKDYQQLFIVQRLVYDLKMPLTIYGAPTVRESDGLAISSRNVYLSKEERDLAPCIQALLQGASLKIKDCRRSQEIEEIVEETKQKFAEYKFALQYLEARDADTLQPISSQTKKAILLVAAHLGKVRLIDNIIFNAPRL